VFTAFPGVLAKGQWVGNPLRAEFLTQPAPESRFAGRSGPLKVLVVGGSLGARVLNTVVPQALALIAPALRPQVTHQSGEKQIDALRTSYESVGIAVHLSVAGPSQDAKAHSGGSVVREATSVGVTITPFIDNTAQAFADADVVICRAGASTVTELAAVGVAAVMVPLPTAVDDHQTHNARFLVNQGAGMCVQQSNLNPEMLAALLQKLERPTLLQWGLQAQKIQKMQATDAVVAACEELTS
jgi:UDP-N-acetylglucosamine--N-acetylmuramyl-(pentapeptide) pyrophosphoryl-undecaprenol N-acetylglucosamine transferase